MIDSNELMIGNWVYDIGGKPHQWSIYDYTLNEDFYSPIPLTPEILEKAGFDDLRRLYLKSQWYDYPKDNLPKLTAITNDEFEISRSALGSFHPQCKYLHQLQNLYYSLTQQHLIVQL